MADLAHVLRQLPRTANKNLLVGDDPSDDAAVYRIAEDRALVQTVDFFTPIVDDPYTFGAIAVANSLSDVYAVGGTPVTALNIVGFPIKTLPVAVLAEILRGGADKAGEAGVTIVGGHTIDDEEPKYGLAVTGFVDPRRFLSTRHGQPGDLLVLTKPLGTGIISTALKAGRVAESDVRQAVKWMSALNAFSGRAAMRARAHAATDITGFGLLGHLADLCRASGVSAVIDSQAVPLLPGALEYVRGGFIPGGTGTNLAALEEWVRYEPGTTDELLNVLNDPQTSGGLLVALSPEMRETFAHEQHPTVLSTVIGCLAEGNPGKISVL